MLVPNPIFRGDKCPFPSCGRPWCHILSFQKLCQVADIFNSLLCGRNVLVFYAQPNSLSKLKVSCRKRILTSLSFQNKAVQTEEAWIDSISRKYKPQPCLLPLSQFFFLMKLCGVRICSHVSTSPLTCLYVSPTFKAHGNDAILSASRKPTLQPWGHFGLENGGTNKNEITPIQPEACLVCPAPVGKLSFGAPTQSVRGSIDAKNELAIKGRQKLTRALQSPAYSWFYTV